jgi:hypothetical protein
LTRTSQRKYLKITKFRINFSIHTKRNQLQDLYSIRH